MANLAGFPILAGKVSGERIATTLVTSDSAAITTVETVVASVVAPLVSGRTYRIVFHFGYQLAADTDQAFVRIRENNVTGTEIMLNRVIGRGPGLTHLAFHVETEFTATVTGDKTFVATLIRTVTGTITLNATAGRPTFLYVDYVR